MSRALKITLPDVAVERLEELADETGEPLATLAASLIKQHLVWAPANPRPIPHRVAVASRRRPVWLEPPDRPAEWRARIWAAICALHARYPQQLGALQEGWWTQPAQIETLAALAVWRQQLDQAARDPREELVFQSALNDYAEALRTHGRGVANTWQPDAPPDGWVTA